MEKKAELNKENYVKWLAHVGASTSGSKQELTMRINRLLRYPGLVQKLKAKSEKAYVFPCSLDSVDLPPATAKWRASNDYLPKINNKMFIQYVSMKREGSAGQQKKALQMFTSRNCQCQNSCQRGSNLRQGYDKKKVLRVHATSHCYYV